MTFRSLQRRWRIIRGLVGGLALAVPLAPGLLTRHRLALGAAGGGVVALALVFWRRIGPRGAAALGAAYLLAAAALLALTTDVVRATSGDAVWRIAATAAGLFAAYLALSAYAARTAAGRPPSDDRLAGDWKTDVALAAAFAAILYAGQWRLWTNLSIAPAILLAAALRSFRWPRPAAAALIVCFVAALYEWHGFVETAYVGKIVTPPTDGIAVSLLRHGRPERFPHARVYAPGACETTRGQFYLGEAGRTYRLAPDGRETTLVAGADPPHAVLELCAEGVLVDGSEERRFLRLARLDDGSKIVDLPLEGMPTWLALSADRRYVYAATVNPATIVRVDWRAQRIDRQFRRYVQTDPSFSGIHRLVIQDGRVIGAFSSFFVIDRRDGEVFSLDLDLADFRPLHRFKGAYAYLAPDSADSVYFKAYSREGVWRVRLDGSGAERVAAAAPGYHYLARLESPSLVVATHWTTGEMLAFCTAKPRRRFYLNLGGGGAPMAVRDNVVYTPTAAGFATVVFPKNLCD